VRARVLAVVYTIMTYYTCRYCVYLCTRFVCSNINNIITDRIRIFVLEKNNNFVSYLSLSLSLSVYFLFFFRETNYYNRMRGHKGNRCRCRRWKCPSAVVTRQIICERNRYDLSETRNCFVNERTKRWHDDDENRPDRISLYKIIIPEIM